MMLLVFLSLTALDWRHEWLPAYRNPLEILQRFFIRTVDVM